MKTAKNSQAVNTDNDVNLTPETPKGNVTVASEVKPVSADNVPLTTGGTSQQINKSFKAAREKSPLPLPENQ